MTKSLGTGNVIGPDSPGTIIPLSQLFSLNLDAGYHATQIIIRDRSIGGGHLVNLSDPSHLYPEFTTIQTINYSDLGQWEFVAAPNAYADLIGFQIVESNGVNTVTSDSAGAVVFTSNAIKGIDTPIDLTGVGNAIAAANYGFVIRYYWDSPHSSSQFANYLTNSERIDLVNDHLQIVTVWEDGNNVLTGTMKGTSDAQRAIAHAVLAGQNDGSAIYFAVEPGQSISDAVNYFSQVKTVFDGTGNTHHYTIGVYGTGDILTSVAAYVKYTWLTGASYLTSGTASYATWNINQIAVTDSQNADQTYHTTLDPAGLQISVPNAVRGVDIDIARGDFGAFGGSDDTVKETVPSSITAAAGQTFAFTGASAVLVNDDGLNSETFATVVTANTGILSASGAGVSGTGTHSLSITGTLSQVNAALNTLTYSNSSADTITVTTSDLVDHSSAFKSIGVTINGGPNQPPAVAPVVASKSITVGTDVSWSQLFTVSDQENDTIVLYSVDESNTSGVGGWYIGAMELTGQTFVNPSDLANLHYHVLCEE